MQLRSSAERLGSVPKRTVPQLCAMPASGICWLEHRPPRDAGPVAAQRTEQVLELAQQAPVRLGVVLALGEVDVPLAIDRDAVVGVGEVLGGEPEVERMSGDVVERETGHEPGRAGTQDVGV